MAHQACLAPDANHLLACGPLHTSSKGYDKPPRGDLRAAEVARAYCAHCCKEACQSNHLLYLEEDVTEAVPNARRLGVRLGAMCADVVESPNTILQHAYNDHSGQGEGGFRGATQLEHEAEVISQVWVWWF